MKQIKLNSICYLNKILIKQSYLWQIIIQQMILADSNIVLSECISDSISPNESTFLLITPAINLFQILARQILKMNDKDLYLLINLQDYEIQEINLHIRNYKKQFLLKKIPFNENIEVVKLNSVPKQKRNQHYISGGCYALSSIIILLDLLSKSEIHPAIISRIFLRDIEYIKNYKHILAWITHLIYKQNNTIQIILLSQNVNILKKQVFLNLYRMFFIKKICFWPFGRQQILTRIKSYQTKFEQYQQIIAQTNFQLRMQEILTHLLMYASQRVSGQISDGNVNMQKNYLFQLFMKQKNEFFRGEQYYNRNQLNNLFQVRSLMFKLINYRPMQTLLTYLYFSKTTNIDQIWISSNEKIEGEIQQFTKLLKKQIFELKVRESARTLQTPLIQGIGSFTTNYELKFLFPTTLKMQSLIKILQDLDKIYPKKQQKIGIWIYVTNEKLKNHLNQEIFEYLHYSSKILKLKSVFSLLKQTSDDRLIKFRAIYNKKSKSINDVIILNQNVLMEELYQELLIFFTIHNEFQVKNTLEQVQNIEKYTYNRQIHLEKLKSIKFNYIDIQHLNFNQIYQQEKNLIWNNKFQIFINSATEIPIISSFLRYQNPKIVILHNLSLKILRFLYLYQLQATQKIQKVYVLNVKGSIQESLYCNASTKQDQNFWQISKIRSNIPKYQDDTSSRLKTIKEEGNYNTREGKGMNLIKNLDVKKLELFNFDSINNFGIKKYYVLIDKREFKSPLPSALYHYGFQIVPTFLENGDYILSNEIAIERKSIQTQDLHQSLRLNRLDDQLKRLSSKFQFPYLLIEFSQNIPFNNSRLTKCYSHLKNQHYTMNVRKSIMILLKKYPKVKLIWSKNSDDTAAIFLSLKRGQPQPDINAFSKGQQKMDQKQLIANIQTNNVNMDTQKI